MSFFELYLVTFNCARNLVNPETLAPNLFDALPSSQPIPDVFAISLQEIAPIAYSFLGGSFLTHYFDSVSATVQLAAKIRSNGQERFEHVTTRSIGMTGLMVFAKPELARRIQWIQSAAAGVGLWNMGNKGAVGVRLGISTDNQEDQDNDELILTLIAAHLAPAEGNVEARNTDWENIVRNLVFLNNDQSGFTYAEEQPLLSSASPKPPEQNGIYDIGSHIIFAGDLNYRTRDEAPGKSAHQSFPQPTEPESSHLHFSHLLGTDQLNRERSANRTLHGFNELPIKFPPTYKYSHEKKDISKTSTQDQFAEEHWLWAKHRWPSYCDRILYIATPPSALEARAYTALPIQSSSDHRPVALSLCIKLQSPSSGQVADTQGMRPFGINPNWKSRKWTARQLEIIVGVLSYLALTRKGNAILMAVGGLTVTTWWMLHWIRAT